MIQSCLLGFGCEIFLQAHVSFLLCRVKWYMTELTSRSGLNRPVVEKPKSEPQESCEICLEATRSWMPIPAHGF